VVLGLIVLLLMTYDGPAPAPADEREPSDTGLSGPGAPEGPTPV
jgi:hypothetical protein